MREPHEMTTEQELASTIDNLVTFSDVAIRIQEKLGDDTSGIEEIAEVIKPDPAVSVALLRLANSAMYAGSAESVTEAISKVGLRQVRDLAFSICAARAFEGIPNELVSVHDFWNHSLLCAVATRHVAKQAKIRSADSLFAAGLLHDIGHLAMFSQDGDSARQALELSIDSDYGVSPTNAERDVFGFDHAGVGAALAAKWQLPDNLVNCIRYHHEPYDSDSVTDALLIVHVANAISVMVELESEDFDDAPPIDPRALEHLGLDPMDLLPAFEDIRSETDDLIGMFANPSS